MAQASHQRYAQKCQQDKPPNSFSPQLHVYSASAIHNQLPFYSKSAKKTTIFFSVTFVSCNQPDNYAIIPVMGNSHNKFVFTCVYTGGFYTMAITKDMSILEVVQKYPDTVDVFVNAGMGCLGCAAAHFENIEQGAMAHGIDIDALISNLNEAVGAEA
jgi:hybrid cluster-associated redox disulfide protein